MKKVNLLAIGFCLAVFAAIQIDEPRQRLEEASSNLESEQEREARENRYDEPLKFFQFHQAIRTPEGAEVPGYPVGHKTVEHLNALRRVNLTSANARTEGTNGVIEFKERGPSNVPGRTKTIISLPGDATQGTWLAGSATGGIWKTTNAGTTWTEKSANFPTYPISSLAMSASNQNVVFAGTGELVSSIYSAVGNGIYKSTDQGETWTGIASTNSNPIFAIVTRIIVDPANINNIVVSTCPSSLTTGSTSKIMRTSDGGATWQKVYENNSAIQQIVATPGNFLVQYATVNGFGVVKSTDGGQTWAASNTGMAPNGRVEIGVSPVNTSRLFASCEGTKSKNGSDLYVSNDAAATWQLVDVSINSSAVDFLNGQGFYDNHVLCDPFNQDVVYFGGVDTYQLTLGTSNTTIDDYTITENGTTGFLSLIQFNNAGFFVGGKLQVGAAAAKRTVEIRFGSGITQKAHRFLVPVGSTSGVAVNNYTYTDYVDVPLQAWDVTSPSTPQQLMVSFRDQSRNGALDFLLQNFDTSLPLLNSREYLYVHSAAYDATTPLFQANSTGGQETQFSYAVFPSLPTGGTWTPNSLPTSNVKITYVGIPKVSASTVTVTDVRNTSGGKNSQNQSQLSSGGVHADHHFSYPIITSVANKTYRILLTTDGGVFVSNSSSSPGINNGDWAFTGNGYNTSQFYGADKKPGADEYIGGMQDNGTRISTSGEVASKTTRYNYAIGGDGFEAVWHSLDPKKIMGSLYNNAFYRSLDGGTSWAAAYSGFSLSNGSPDATKYPFVSKLGQSKNLPDVVFAVGSDGVWKSTNFGGSWSLTPITSQWGTATTFFDVEVSRANANVVWAGGGMSASRSVFVSKNGGTSFTATTNYPTATLGLITRLASHPVDQNTAYALFSFYGKPKILRTTDFGANWTDITGFNAGSVSTNGFPDVATYCVYVMPDNPNIIWAGTEIGIIQSLDNGGTWALLTDFPSVSVWDMKGQDDQIVIATHGRGIWTAKMTANQNIGSRATITAGGTTPQNNYALRIQLPATYDSAVLFINSQRVGKFVNSAPITTVKIKNVPTGSVTAYFITYTGNSPVQSSTFSGTNLLLKLPYASQYSNLFTSISDFSNQVDFRQFDFGTSNQSMQTNHSYPANSDLSTVLLKPIIVSNANSNFFYQDIAIVQPGKDFVAVEATKNGLDWIAIKGPYDASANQAWQTAFTGSQPGTPSTQVDQSVDLKTKFAANDTLLFRFRLKSDNDNITGWGWSIDNLFIQQPPTGIELSEVLDEFVVFPNPTQDKITISYKLKDEANVVLTLLDATGKSNIEEPLGKKSAGSYQREWDLSGKSEGIYFVRLKTEQGMRTTKVILKK